MSEMPDLPVNFNIVFIQNISWVNDCFCATSNTKIEENYRIAASFRGQAFYRKLP